MHGAAISKINGLEKANAKMLKSVVANYCPEECKEEVFAKAVEDNIEQLEAFLLSTPSTAEEIADEFLEYLAHSIQSLNIAGSKTDQIAQALLDSYDNALKRIKPDNSGPEFTPISYV